MTAPLDDGSYANNPETHQIPADGNSSSSRYISPLEPDNLNAIAASERASTYHQSNKHDSRQQQSNVATFSTSPMAQTLSPSHLMVHEMYAQRSEDYLSNPGYVDASQYTTPIFDQQLFNEHHELPFDSQDTLQYGLRHTSGPAQSFGPYSSSQPANFMSVSSSALVAADFQLYSPNLTHASSPIPVEMNYISAFTPNGQPSGSATTTQPTLSLLEPTSHMHTPATNPYRSPFSTGSPSVVTSAISTTLPAHLKSPIVRIENFGMEESPPTAPLSRSLSKRSHASRKSATHLSPYPADDSSVDNDGDNMQAAREDLRRLAVNQPSVQRSEDGSWLATHSGPAGIHPEARESMEASNVPTLEEQEKERQLAEKNADVHEWLVHSEVCSQADDPNGSTNSGRMRRNAGRRRARSTNDAGARQSLSLNPALVVQTSVFPEASIPGPGVYLDEESGDDDEEYISNPEIDIPKSPPTKVPVGSAADEAFYSPTTPFSTQAAAFPGQLALDYSWNNRSRLTEPSAGSQQSFTANQAIMRFRQKVKDVESASLTATIGSRRRSESDVGSLFAAAGISVRVGDRANTQEKSKAIKDQELARKGSERRGSFLDRVSFRRSSTNNILRRKKSDAGQQQPDGGATDTAQGDTQTTTQPRKRKGSSSRPKSPRLDTDVILIPSDGAHTSALSASAPGKAFAQARNSLRKVRSRSDVGKMSRLKELMSQHGGPPMLTLPSPANDSGSTDVQRTPDTKTLAEDHDEDDLSAQDAVKMNLAVRSDPIIPDYEGFKTHIQHLNPRLPEYMLERATQEQIRRYKRLLEAKIKHLNCVQRGNCSLEFCTALGGEGKEIPPRTDGRGFADPPSTGFHVTAPGSGDEGAENLGDGTVQAAQFPLGVPQPPVKRLPAEFECPLCFQVKKFYKPSDWTKHVHEDVQPFTCTFPNCAEPKSFKRKADWVRHENERHRQLESWTCTMPDCGHTCYRKDNFVQHLVREHKVPEPRARTGRSSNAAARNMAVNLEDIVIEDIVRRHSGDHAAGQIPEDVSEQVWAFVELCRHDAPKQPEDEPCRFCSNKCNSWKKLTVHLAKHMEQISLPVLPLVEQKHLQPDSVISPVDAQQQHRSQTVSPASAVLKSGSPYISRNGSTHLRETGVGPLEMGFHTSGTQYPVVPTIAAPVMHTYPPPQFANHGVQYHQTSYAYNDLSNTPGNFSGSSYPPVASLAQSFGNAQSAASGPSQLQQHRYAPHASSRFIPSATPASAYGQQPMYASPTDATPFPSDSTMPMQFPHAGHPTSALNTSNQAVQTSNPYDHSEALPCSGSQYQQVPSYVYQQQLYPFHSR